MLRRAFAPFGRLLDFAGRDRRADYWPYALVLLVLYAAGLGASFAEDEFRPGPLLAFLYALVGLLALLGFAATVRRLHDVGWSGWWAGAYLALLAGHIAFFFYWRYGLTISERWDMLDYMPLILGAGLTTTGLGLLLFALCLLDGTAGANRHGPDPKGRSAP